MENGLEALRPYIGQELSVIPSPAGHWMKGILQEIGESSLKVAFVVREDMINPARVLHGGMIATMLDEVMGISVMVKFSEGFTNYSFFYTTVNLHIDYLASTREGATVIASSNIIKAGNKIANVEGWLHDSGNGKLLAHATCNMLRVEMRA